MSTLSWTLSTTPAQAPEYWLLFVDGFPCTSLQRQAPYRGPGQYSADLTQLDPGSPVPTDGAPHSYSVALVGAGTTGPQSASVSITLPPPGVQKSVAVATQQPVWPTADTVTAT